MSDVVILGAGVMGSAMTLPIAASGATVALVGTHLDEDIIRSVAGNGLHPRLGVTLPPKVKTYQSTQFGTAMADEPKFLLLGVASAGVAWAIDRIVESVRSPVPILMITKGLASGGDRLEALPHVVAREVEARTGMRMPVLAIGGPCIAGELAVQRDTSVVLTGTDSEALASVKQRLNAPFYHVRISEDVIGVEICAAFKNFYTLAVGAAAGRLEAEGKAENGGLMHNLSSSLFTQALAEMTILVEAHGGNPRTVMGLAGSGDLYVTCQAGRNGRMGRLLGLGLPYSRAKAEHMVADTVEGAELARSLGPTLDMMWDKGRLPSHQMPLGRAIVDAVCRDAPLVLDFSKFHDA